MYSTLTLARSLYREDPPLDFFVFESGLLDNQVAPKVEAGKVVINNLTCNSMKTRYTYDCS